LGRPHAVVANNYNDSISVIDTATRTVRLNISSLRDEQRFACAPGGTSRTASS
jgi:YVTN family beta-propeller protein